MKWEDATALVTGASRGIGRAIALELGRRGATVVGTATRQAGADAVSESLAESAINGCGMVLDVTDDAAVQHLLGEMEARFGAPSIVVNNAGITSDNLLMRMKDEEWDRVLDANLKGAFRLCKGVLRPMLKGRWGRIVNVGSVVGTTGNPGQCNYAAAKAGLAGFTRSLAREVAQRGITVNLVAPGFIDTDMTQALPEAQRDALIEQIPAARLGTAEDIAQAVTFLASPDAGYITGATLEVNGGMHMQ